MKIWHISDTHGLHHHLSVPEDIDLVIHSGDATNSHNVIDNSIELWAFLEWFQDLPIKNKVLVSGNHDKALERRMASKNSLLELGVHYLENSSVEIDGVKIWGSPFTPSFGEWSFMMKRNKIAMVWDLIPADTNVLVTHGPPKTVLDLTVDRDNVLTQVGCKSLYNKIVEVQPLFHCFGHIHDEKGIRNAGVLKLSGMKTVFSNASCVETGKLQEGIKNNGNILILDT